MLTRGLPGGVLPRSERCAWCHLGTGRWRIAAVAGSSCRAPVLGRLLSGERFWSGCSVGSAQTWPDSMNSMIRSGSRGAKVRISRWRALIAERELLGWRGSWSPGSASCLFDKLARVFVFVCFICWLVVLFPVNLTASLGSFSCGWKYDWLKNERWWERGFYVHRLTAW